MPTSLATLLSCCRRCVGPVALLLVLPPGPSIAATAPGALKRSDTLDMRRAGKLSEDERAVLRIEWRAGMSGVDADRRVQEIMAKLRQMEANVKVVGQTLRSLPAEKRTVAADPVATAKELDAGFDWRLMAGNATALILVLIWWSSRRKAQKEAAALEAQINAKARGEPEIQIPLEPAADAIEPARQAEPRPLAATEMPQPHPSAEPPMQAVIEAPKPPNAPSDNSSVSTPTVLPTDEPVPPESAPVIDFILEEVDPATMVAEKARPAKRPVTLVTPESVSASLKKNVEPTLQLAEIMLSMGLEQGAAQTLVEYTEANPKHAIYHMLKLLGIYRKRGLHQEFQETAEKLRKNFNIQAEDWAKTDSGEAPSLEGFSRVSQHVQSIWDQPEECITYLRHLIEDNRDGARAGFPQSVAEEILLLVEILKETSGSTQEVA